MEQEILSSESSKLPACTKSQGKFLTNPDLDGTDDVPVSCSVAATHTLSTTAAIALTFTPAPSAVAHTRRPSSPRNLSCSAAAATAATWTWDAADRAHSYLYRYSSGDEWTEAGGRSHTRTGIVPSSSVGGWDNRQYIDVMARNNVGDSNPSYSSCLTLPPDWLTAECSAAGQITVTWSKPLGLYQQTGVRYTATVTYGVPSARGVGTLPHYSGTATTSTHAGEPGVTYTVRVQTQPISGKPTYSETTTAECEAVAPPAPTGVEVECTSANRVVVRWSPAVGADKYRVSVTERPPAPARPSVDDRTVAHFDPPEGQKLSLPVPGTIGWDYTATVTSIKTVAGSDLESASATSAARVRCAGVVVRCQADGRLKATWVRNPQATRYRLQISVTTTTSTQVTALPDIFVAQPAQAARTISHYYDSARAGNRYEVRVAAEVNGTFAADSAPAGDTCEAVVPPAPAGVTASCANRVLTVAWSPAGTGLAKATAYKPRIFIYDAVSESWVMSNNWTANTAGHDTTSATIPAQGEDDLPETGVFQVKVKATNTAGDSDWSDPVDVTCAKPGPVGGVECTVVSDDSITVEWSPVVGADGYQAVASIWDVASPLNAGLLGWEDAGIPRMTSSGKFVYELDGLDSEVDYYLGVRARNSSGLGDLDSGSVQQCETIDDDWFAVRCTGNGVLVAQWSDPSGDLPDPSGYSVTAHMASSPFGSGVVGTYSGVGLTRSWLVPPNQEYLVEIETGNASGGPVYAKTVKASCPLLSAPDYNGPNVPQDVPGWLGWAVWLKNLTCIDDHCSNWQNSTSTDVGSIANYTPIFIGGDYAVVPKSRDCERSTDTATGHVTQICEEVWNEHISVRVDESSLDETAATLEDFYIPEDIPDINATTIENAIKYAATTLAGYWESIKAAGVLGVRAAVKLSLTAAAGHAVGVWLYHEANQPWAEINGLDNCVFDPPENRGSDIKAWNRQSSTANATTTVGNITTIRNATVHYCQEEE